MCRSQYWDVLLSGQASHDEHRNTLAENHHISEKSRKRQKKLSLACYTIVPKEVFCEAKNAPN